MPMEKWVEIDGVAARVALRCEIRAIWRGGTVVGKVVFWWGRWLGRRLVGARAECSHRRSSPSY